MPGGMTITKNRRSSRAGNTARRGKKGEARANNLITLANAECHQGQQNGICAGRHADGMLGTKILGRARFKFLHLRAHDEVSRCEDALKGSTQLIRNGMILSVYVKQGNIHATGDEVWKGGSVEDRFNAAVILALAWSVKRLTARDLTVRPVLSITLWITPGVSRVMRVGLIPQAIMPAATVSLV